MDGKGKTFDKTNSYVGYPTKSHPVAMQSSQLGGAVMSVPIIEEGKWSTGLFDCFSHVPTAFMSACLPCIRWPQSVHRAGLFSYPRAILLYMALLFVLHKTAQLITLGVVLLTQGPPEEDVMSLRLEDDESDSFENFDPVGEKMDPGHGVWGKHGHHGGHGHGYHDREVVDAVDSSEGEFDPVCIVAYCVLVSLMFPLLYGLVFGYYRKQLRDKYGIEGTYLKDTCAHMWCTCCAKTQEAHHVDVAEHGYPAGCILSGKPPQMMMVRVEMV